MLSLGFSLPPPSNNKLIITNKNQYNFRTNFGKVCSDNINAAGDQLVTLPEGLKHVAVIMDGHRRWAKNKGLTVKQGHHAGGEKIQVLTRLCHQYNFRTKVLATTTNSSSNSYNAAAMELGRAPAVALPEGLKLELMPKHVAVIMDGHRRWARQKGLSVEHGHRAGGEKMKVLTRLCNQWRIKVLTLFVFSTENWTRPKEEVDFLMELCLAMASSLENLDEWTRDNIRFSFIGDKSILSKSLREALILREETTKSNSGLHVMVALNYSGRQDILQATKSIASKVNNGHLAVKDIDNNIFEQELETHRAEFPEPDLLIRTSGEQRISNFMLWQLAYTELYFAKKLFPDMEQEDFIDALKSFQPRERRYGGSQNI